MTFDLKQAAADIAADRDEIIDRLVKFSTTDMLLFWGNEKTLIERQNKIWNPIIKWVNDSMACHFKATHGLDVAENEEDGARVRHFLKSLSGKELAAFYAAALATRSVLLASALVRGKINAEQAFEAAYLEELWQAENWGSVEEAEKSRAERKKEIADIAAFLKS